MEILLTLRWLCLVRIDQVWFHFLYHSMLRRMSEKRSEYSCAWCNMFAGSLRGLVAHLVSSHDRFRFQATVRLSTEWCYGFKWY
jgi:hypothetical protein